MFSINNFVFFWIFIELLMLIFMGLAYSTTINSFRYLINYFLIQSYSSFSILIFYLADNSLFLTLAFILKLCMFPFHYWVISLGYRLNNFLLLIISTVHKLPVFMMFLIFHVRLSPFVLEFSIISSIVVSFVTMFVRDYRLLLVCSSIGNNSWFLFSSFCNYSTFFIFFFFYSVSFFFSILLLKSFSKPSLNSKSLCSFFLLSLSGLPPFPIFFVKVLVIYQLSFLYPSVFLALVLLVNSVMISAYIYYSLNSLLYHFSSESTVFSSY